MGGYGHRSWCLRYLSPTPPIVGYPACKTSLSRENFGSLIVFLFWVNWNEILPAEEQYNLLSINFKTLNLVSIFLIFLVNNLSFIFLFKLKKFYLRTNYF